MVFPTPELNTPLEMLTYVGTVTNSWFWPFALMAIFGIMVGTLKINNDWAESFSASTFFTGVIGMLLGLMSLVDSSITLICLALAFLGAFMLLWKRHNTTS